MPSTFCVSQKITECADSPKVTYSGLNSTMTRKYEINAASVSDALGILFDQVSLPFVMGIHLTATPTLRIEPRWNPADGSGGVGCYSGSIEYRHPGRDEQTQEQNELYEPEYGREKVTASFTGETEHTTHAISQYHYGLLSRDTNRAINVQSNGEVEGLDINKRTGSFTVSTLIHKDIADNEWFKDRFYQIWTVNEEPFRSWPKGCVALAGMDSRQRADGHWEVDYSFQISPPRKEVSQLAGVTLTQAGSPVTIDIEGFEYVWVMYQPTDAVNDQSGNQVITPKAVGVHVAKIYNYSDFSKLGILT